MPLDISTPVVADIAAFSGGDAGKAAKLNYNVPLPGSYSWRHVTPLKLNAAWFANDAATLGTSLVDRGIVATDQVAVTAIDAGRLALFYRQALPAGSRPSLRLVAEVGADVQPLMTEMMPRGDQLRPADSRIDLLGRRAVIAEPEDVDIQRRRVDSYLTQLASVQSNAVVAGGPAVVTLPVPGIGNSIQHVPVDPLAKARPRVALVETWELRSFLGDYGVGRTLQTFSLLPGERTTITVNTWRSEAATREDATSIFDSADTAAQSRFTTGLQESSGTSSQDSGGWAASVSTSVSAGASFGIVSGSASVSAGFAANHQEASQRFSNSASQSASDHAAQVNNSRRQAVESSSTTSTTTGAETTTVREISNTNLRRVLNFVFRELNQSYDTYVCLRDIQVAFYNGNPGSAEIVSLAEIDGLVSRHLRADRREEVARALLTLAAQRIDAYGDVVATLEVGRSPRGVTYEWSDAGLGEDGMIDGPVLASDIRWRFKHGSLSEEPNGRTMPGVILKQDSVTLRTDNLIVEALLGQADALDPYATAVQALDLLDRRAKIDDRAAQTKKISDALALVATPDEAKVAAYERLFPDEPEIQVVPAAAVTENGHPSPNQ